MATFSSTVLGILVRLVQFGRFLAPWFSFIFWLHIQDLYYLALNAVKGKKPEGQVITPGHPGSRGCWPEYRPPTPGKDSRSPCPGLNTLANHGILPHDGKRVTYEQMSKAIQKTYNLAPSLGNQLTASALQLDQGRGWINLEDLSAMNVIQHDASFTRPDIAHCPDQSHPHAKLVDRYLASASDSKRLSVDDIAYYSAVRRDECKNTNGQYSLKWSFLHEFFGSGNGALMYSIFGGVVEDLRIWLAQERLPEGWEPKNREAIGHTIIASGKPFPGISMKLTMSIASPDYVARNRVQYV